MSATNLLPQTVAEIVEIIGYGKTKSLVDRLGGKRFRLTGPMRDEIIGIIGPESYRDLIERFGNEQLELERCHKLLRHVRIAETMEALRNGKNMNTMATEQGVTRRTIRYWKKASVVIDPDDLQDEQLDLFN